MAKMAALTLTNICLDVQIAICMFIHPSDILALRKTCKAFQRSTRRRVVWVDALHRVCLDNGLFLPSFPIDDMSDLELEKAAMGPRRWIGLCGAFEKANDPAAILCPRATRIINDLFPFEVDYETTNFIFVPGGRYLVGYSPDGISVLDLGYTSSSNCKLIASVRMEGECDISCKVQATPDGMGLVIFSSIEFEGCSVFDIYPEDETHLTEIAYLDIDSINDLPGYLLPDKVIWFKCLKDRIVFRVWDYRLDHSLIFSVDVDVEKLGFDLEVAATNTAVIVLCGEGILIWAIPPLSPQPPDSDVFEYSSDMPRLPPLFTLSFPDGIGIHPARVTWNTTTSWYPNSSYPFYYDMLCRDNKLHRFQIMLKPDLSTASLHFINTFEPSPHDLRNVIFDDYNICEDAVVSLWLRDSPFQSGVYTGLTSARFANIISQGGPAAKMLLPDIGHVYRPYPCPASGRFVLLDASDSVTVYDFF